MTDIESEWLRKCDVCGKGSTKRSWESRHEPHEKGCKRDGCACDLVTHPGCCPECEPKAVARYWDLQAVKQWAAEQVQP